MNYRPIRGHHPLDYRSCNATINFTWDPSAWCPQGKYQVRYLNVVITSNMALAQNTTTQGEIAILEINFLQIENREISQFLS